MVKVKTSEFESIGQEYALQLEKLLNIHTVDDFLKYSLEEIHERSQIDMERLEQWRDLIDLFRVPNLSARECELLYFANINSVKELSHRQSLRIFYKLREIDAETRFIVLDFPTFAQIDEWIYFAKTMSKRIKYGLNVPIIMFPMVSIDIASELKKFNIFTAEDLLIKENVIKNLAKKMNIQEYKFKELKQMIDLIKIGGIDIYFADIFRKVGIVSSELLLSIDEQEILRLVEEYQATEKESVEKLTLAHIKEFKKNLEAE